MPVGAINTAKELTSGYQPLVLTTITFTNGDVLRWATHDLSGPLVYDGNAYQPRIVNQEGLLRQALGEQGFDIPASVKIRVSDADLATWTYMAGRGAKGAALQMRLVFWSVGQADFSNNSKVLFLGVCLPSDLPQHDGSYLTIGFTSKMNLAGIAIPPVRIQKTCPWAFPGTATQRQAAADDSSSPFYRCGYSPDASGGNARGNGSFTTCDKTKDDCLARGMYIADGASRITGRFGGVTWSPPTSSESRSYITGKRDTITNNANEAKYGEVVPFVLGTGWVNAKVLNVVGDGNLTKMEVLCCLGEVSYIHEVVVNDTRIPHTFDDAEMPGVPIGVSNAKDATKGGFWFAVNRGDRSGRPNPDALFDALGDPYGSLCVLSIAVPIKLAGASTVPKVRVLVERGTSNPITQIKELLPQMGIRASEIDDTAFANEASYADATVTYENQFGVTTSHKRFSSSLVLEQSRAAAEVLRGLRNATMAAMDVNDSGQVTIRTMRSLAGQQPSPVAGSNYNTAVGSGYVAYRFDATNILGSVTPIESSGGNKFSVVFQNSENRWGQDLFSLVDSEDVARTRLASDQFQVEGVNTFDQLTRIYANHFARSNRGNPRGDTGGSLAFRWEATFRAVHLRVGDIVMLNWAPLGLSDQLLRIARLQPTTNFARCEIVATWHNDAWYADSYGQVSEQRNQGGERNRLSRPSWAWYPGLAQPPSGDSMFDRDEWNFEIGQEYEVGAAGPIAKITIAGLMPVNETSPVGAPFVPIQGNVSGGGTLAGGRSYFLRLVGKDADGKYTLPSEIVSAYVASGSSQITIPSVYWSAGTSGYAIAAGTRPDMIGIQSEHSGAPSSVSLASYKPKLYGIPDQEFDRIRFKVKRILHGGVWGAEVTAVTTSTITVSVPGAGFTTNQWANYDVSKYADTGNGGVTRIYNSLVTANNEDKLTVAVNPSISVAVGDVVVLRSRPTVGADYLEDAGWENVFAPAGLEPGALQGALLRIISGAAGGFVLRIADNTSTRITLESMPPFPMDSSTRYIIEEPNWQIVSESSSTTNVSATTRIDAAIDVSNYAGKSLLVAGVTVDGGGNECGEADSPMREIYIYGQAAGDSNGYYQTASGAADTITPDLADGFTQEITLGRPSTTIAFPVFTGGTITQGTRFTLKILQDATGDRALVWHADYVGVGAYPIPGEAGTYSMFPFVIRPDGKAELWNEPSLGIPNS